MQEIYFHSVIKILFQVQTKSLVKPSSNIITTEILFDDVENVDIIFYAEQIFSLLDSNKKTLVHCSAGRSRSCSIVIFYIMKKYNISFNEAYKLMREKRPNTYLHNGFFKQLQLYKMY